MHPVFAHLGLLRSERRAGGQMQRPKATRMKRCDWHGRAQHRSAPGRVGGRRAGLSPEKPTGMQGRPDHPSRLAVAHASAIPPGPREPPRPYMDPSWALPPQGSCWRPSRRRWSHFSLPPVQASGEDNLFRPPSPASPLRPPDDRRCQIHAHPCALDTPPDPASWAPLRPPAMIADPNQGPCTPPTQSSLSTSLDHTHSPPPTSTA